MNKITDFFELDTWKENHTVGLMIYKITKRFPKEEKYGVTSQIRRAVSSITANIAEGFGRYHYADKVRFYHQARGSIKETQNFLFLAEDLGYMTTDQVKKIWEQSKIGEKLLNGLIKSTQKQKK